MDFFAVPYDIHFDDTMAYGSHHFLTNFKFQCAGREHLLFSPHAFETPEFRSDFEQVLLLTYEGYSRNLAPAALGDRLVVLTSLEARGEVSLRFCFRTLKRDGTPVACGYQTVLCADRQGALRAFPESFQRSFEALAALHEPAGPKTFRDLSLQGGAGVQALFPEAVRGLARTLLADTAPRGVSRTVHLPDPAPVKSPQEASASTPGLGAPGSGATSSGLPRTMHPPGPVAEGSPNMPQASASEPYSPPGKAAPGGASRTKHLSDPTSEESLNDAPASTPALQLPTGATAFLFAGQGTFEPALFLKLKALQPELRAELVSVSEACRTQGIDVGPLLAAEEVKQVHRALDAAPLLDQLGIFLSGVLGARWLERQGTRPDVFVGHSFGEIAAMTAAGALDLRAGAEVVCRRIRALQTVPDDLGTLAAVALSAPETVRAMKEGGARSLEVAGRNHPRQTVVAGPREELERLRAFLERQGKGFTFISSRYPFHHPCLAPAVAAFRESLAELAVQPVRGPIYSPIERRVYAGGRTELAGALASHLVRPFDFPGAIETLVGAGCTRFVDCGTGGRLTRIAQRILPTNTSITLTSVDRALPSNPPVVRDATPGAPAVAVVSLGCMLPGGAKDPETYWRNIQRGISGIVDTGLSHPDQVVDFVGPAETPDRTYTLLTGRVLDSDLVPPPGIAPARFRRYGREQQLLAIALSQAMESLRSTEPRAPGRIQCLLGSTADGSPEYDDALCLEAGEALLSARGDTDREFSALMREALGVSAASSELAPHPTLQAVVTDVVGPAVSTVLLDAACASSLYAIALGMKALERGDADLVLAGGGFSPGPGNSCLFSQFKGLSATGSRPFDERADGVIFGEGAGIVGLMRLEDAVSEGLKVHAVIRGAGISSDGRSSSANVPRADGQVAAMEACYAAAGVEPASIQYIEAHGTATPAGDTTELQSIGRVFGGKRKGLQLASVKALIGHVGWAAGAASVIKLCKALEHRSFPPQSHFDRPGAGLRALGPDFEVSTREQPWPENGDQPRRAATNGFGFGGTNAHLVLEEYRGGPLAPRARAAPSTEGALVVVAAEGMFPEARFAAKGLRLPASVRLLPDITEDMDLTQHLGLIVASDLVKKLGAFDSLRMGTAIVLGLEGKTRRGVEATQRVLADSTRRRLREHLQRTPDSARLLPLVDRLHAAVGALRPTGPYTLQGMMPNVTPGRVAGVLDTKGPNFVVDAGASTLAASLRASTALLESGFELVLVGSAHVRRPGDGPTASAPEEGMTMLAVTTVAKAEAHGLKPLCHLWMAEEAGAGPGITLPPHSAEEAQDVLSAVRAAAEGRSSTLRFHPDAATGARLVLQVRPGRSAQSEASEGQSMAARPPSGARRDLEPSAGLSDMTPALSAEKREPRGDAPPAGHRTNLSDSRTGLDDQFGSSPTDACALLRPSDPTPSPARDETHPPQPGSGNLSDSRTGLESRAGPSGANERTLTHAFGPAAPLPMDGTRPSPRSSGNLSDSRTGWENQGTEGRPLQPAQENVSDSRTGLDLSQPAESPQPPGHGNLSDSRPGLASSARKAQSPHPSSRNLSDSRPGLNRTGPEGSPLQPSREDLSDSRTDLNRAGREEFWLQSNHGNLSDRRIGLDHAGLKGLPLQPSRENLSDSRTGLDHAAPEGSPPLPGHGNLSDRRTGLGHSGPEGVLLHPNHGNLPDSGTGLGPSAPEESPPKPSHGNLSDSRTGLEHAAPEGRPFPPGIGNLSDSRTGLGFSGPEEVLLQPGHGNLSDSRTGLANRVGREATGLEVRGAGASFAPGAIATTPLHSESAASATTDAVQTRVGAARMGDVRPPPISSATPPETADGFDHSAPIRYHAPVLVERPAVATGASRLRGRRVLFIAQDESVARELATQAPDVCGPEFRILHAGSSDTGARIHGIDLTREETAEAGLEALHFEPQVIVAVCRMSSGETESSVIADTALRHEALELLFLAARRAYERLSAGTVSLASLCIGGVGAHRRLHPVTGLFAGLLKSLGREVPARGIRAIATSPLSLSAALDHVASELSAGDDSAPVEVCFDGAVRCVRLLQPTDLPARPAVTLDSRSVVLLTGGGRGVTAVLAGALLKRYGCKVILLGRSDPTDAPERVLQARDEELGAVEREFYASELARDSAVRMPALRARFERHLAVRELRATLDGLTRLPGQMTYRAVDVTRPEDVDRVVEELIREHGRLDLVIHGAGTQVSKKLQRRRLTELRSTLDTKLLGLRNLRESCARRLPAPVPFHVLTSAFSYIGNDGQADYGAANEALDRLCAWVSDARQDVQWCSVGWLAWDGIGMTRGSEYRVLGASRRLRGIRAEEGEALFLQLVEGQPIHPINVQLTESERAFYGLEVLSPAPRPTRSDRTEDSASVPAQEALAPPPPTPEPPRPTRKHLTVDAASVPCLEDHLVRGTPTLPGAWALDLMFQAALDDARPELRTVTIEDVRFSRFIRVKPGGQQPLRAECTPLTDAPGQHSVQVKLTGDVVHASGVVLERDLVYAEARFTLTAEPPRASPRLEAARASGHGVAAHDPHCTSGSPIELRRMFDCLEEIRLEQDARFARLGLPETPREAGHGVPALVLDAALRLSAMHVEGVSNDVFAPVGVQRATFDRDLVAHGASAPRRLTLKALAPRVEGALLQCGTAAAHDETGRLRMLVEGGVARPMA